MKDWLRTLLRQLIFWATNCHEWDHWRCWYLEDGRSKSVSLLVRRPPPYLDVPKVPPCRWYSDPSPLSDMATIEVQRYALHDLDFDRCTAFYVPLRRNP